METKDQTMTFGEWLRHKGLKDSTIKHYELAIEGSISNWAIVNNVLAGPLTAINSTELFSVVSQQIQELPIFKEHNDRGNRMYSSALSKYAQYISEGDSADIEADIDTILTAKDISETQKSSLIKTRIGQGMFRQKLLAYWGGCAVTGFKDTNLLVASHIKPWHKSNATERLDQYNGLILLPTLDRAFDRGFISFQRTGEIAISPQLVEPERIAINPGLRVDLAAQHEPYMAFHREMVFRSE